jgi:MHS family proline/betaine transporter-like MFS transporter
MTTNDSAARGISPSLQEKIDSVTPEVGASTVRRAVIAAGIGNFVEWFSYGIYGFLAPTLAALFFPSENRTISLLATFAVFGIAFLVNPLGGIFFGPLGDRYGRQRVLATVIILMAASTFLIGVLPTHASVGLLAPLLLVLLRMIQGFSAGGEPAGAATFLLEYARPGRRAFSVAFWPVSSFLGNAFAAIVVFGMYAVVPDEAMTSWGWRFPFLLCGPIGLIGLYIRLKMEDTPEFRALEAAGEVAEAPLREALRFSWRQILQAAGCFVLQFVAFYLVLIYMQTYFIEELGFSSSTASLSTLVALLVAAATILPWAHLADRVGRKPLMLGASAGFAVLTYPVLVLMNSGGLTGAVIGHLVLVVLLTMWMGAANAALTEIFPSRVRYTGFGIGFNISGPVFGGMAPFLATWLISSTGSSLSPALLFVVSAVVALTTVLTLKETGRMAQLQHSISHG